MSTGGNDLPKDVWTIIAGLTNHRGLETLKVLTKASKSAADDEIAKLVAKASVEINLLSDALGNLKKKLEYWKVKYKGHFDNKCEAKATKWLSKFRTILPNAKAAIAKLPAEDRKRYALDKNLNSLVAEFLDVEIFLKKFFEF